MKKFLAFCLLLLATTGLCAGFLVSLSVIYLHAGPLGFFGTVTFLTAILAAPWAIETLDN